MKQNKVNINDMDNQLQQFATQSQAIFGNNVGGNQFQILTKILTQYEYIKQKIQCKPEYLQEFVKNYQDLFGLVNQSVGFNAKMSEDLKNQNNKRLQAEFNKLEMLKKAILLGFNKQILILMEDQKQSDIVKKQVEYITLQIADQNKEFKQEQEQKESITLHSFKNDTTMKEHIKNHSKSSPVIIITTRSQLFNNSVLEYLNDQNNVKFLRLEGVICLCDPQKLQNTKSQLQLCSVPFRFIDNQDQICQELYDLINKNQFLRIISLEDFSFYITKKPVQYFSDKINTEYKNNKTLYSLKQQNYLDLFQKLANYIDNNNIPVYKENYNKQAIKFMCKHLQDNVFNTQNEEQLASNFIYFYTMESPFYKLVNSCLNILNEGLISCLEPIILPLQLALKKAKSQEQSIFSLTKEQYVTLYRGTTIPQGQLDLISKNKQLVFPSFSSFTSSEKVALSFMKTTKSDQDSVRIIFIVKFQKDQNPDQNPKYLKYLSAIPSEEEYLIPPFTLFKVSESKKDNDFYQVFLNN
ncbi:NAD:arginine ADP-ribosyltransferase (macronuclear) [Tetrahymena thermophila SB210]|uniref:NAD(P)(+)--arginine ADP-ribosyltransferase n=1 Tax=Tetrahymena thermophila (strain SB210) TaxID=312017 RepID=Q248I0_TETTS|nr:NAD:arginine ADP-ribosyltransferase [Tetrahymena thermophila SB210]EAS04065.2 NAD:arginine ADP-ribosyltransferase [Tetrahymena thermophila SB210]|eukprot:XP_001024310.2 NAD:arginine ADP-ribosyltransferase [Tetrahymena thermophila SB210]